MLVLITTTTTDFAAADFEKIKKKIRKIISLVSCMPVQLEMLLNRTNNQTIHI